MNEILGWYESPGSIKPDHDPGEDTPCPFCKDLVSHSVIGVVTTLKGIVTVSIMPDGHRRSYFYRAHAWCYRTARPAAVRDLEDEILEYIDGNAV